MTKLNTLKEQQAEDLVDAKQAVIDAKKDFETAKKWYLSRIDAYDLLKAEISEIECDCDDTSCGKKGQEGEVARHIENCSCAECHSKMGKL